MGRTKTKVESSNITEFEKQFTENLKLKNLEDTIQNLNKTIDNLLKKIEEKDQEIYSLQQTLNEPVIKSLAVPLADEELISNAQLDRLKQAAMNRELSLEEVKKFDLLVKNKRLSQGDSTTIVADYKNLSPSLQKPDLIKLASKKSSSDSTDGQN